MKKLLLILLILAIIPFVSAAGNETNTTSYVDGDCHDTDDDKKDYIKIWTFQIPGFLESGLSIINDVFEVRAINCVPPTHYEVVGLKIAAILLVVLLFVLYKIIR